MKTASSMSRSLSDGTVRWDAASNFHSGTGALGGFVQHVFSLPAHSQPRTLELRAPRRQSKNALYYADLWIMPTISSERALAVAIAAMESA